MREEKKDMERPTGRNAAAGLTAGPVRAAGAIGNGGAEHGGPEALRRETGQRPWGAWVCLALAMSIAGSAVVAGKLLVGRLPVFLAAELGLGVGLLTMLPQLLARHENAPLGGRTHATLAFQALCGIVLYRVCTFEGLRFTSAASAGLMSSAAPVMIGLLSWAFLHERPPLRRIGGIACVSLGLLVLNLTPLASAMGVGGAAAHGWRTLLGNGLVLAAVLCEAAFSVLSKAACRPMSALRRTTLVSAYAFLMLLVPAIMDARNCAPDALTAVTAGSIIYYGVAVSWLSYVLWFKGIATVPASAAAVFTGLVPLSGVALSWLVLGENLLWTHLAGLTCVVAGLWLSCSARERKRAAAPGVGRRAPVAR